MFKQIYFKVLLIFITMILSCSRNTLDDKSSINLNKQDLNYNRITRLSDKEVEKLHDIKTVANSITSKMSLTEKVYQVFMLSVSGNTPKSVIAKNFKHAPGAVILYRFNFTNDVQTTHDFIFTYAKNFQENHRLTSQTSNSIISFFATDNEGGNVFRTSKLTSRLPYVADIVENFSLTETKQIYKLHAQQMKMLGLSMNLAPICETGNPITGILGKRVFSEYPQIVSDFATSFVNAHQSQGIACVLKHFPNSGDADTHQAVSTIDCSYNELLQLCESFQKPLENTSAVMLSHAIVKNFDNLPFCLSKNGINFLKNELKYEGIIISDDIIMKALRSYGKNYSDLAYKLLMAGCDMILYSAPDFNTLIDALVEKAKTNKEFELRLQDAVERILVEKLKIGLIDMHGVLESSNLDFDIEEFQKSKNKCDDLLKSKSLN